MITAEKTVREITATLPCSVKVFDKLGVDFCCGGGKSLQDACMNAGVEFDEVLRRLEEAAAHQSDDPALATWQTATLVDLMSHIVSRHHGFVREEMPRISFLVEKVATKHAPNHPELATIRAAWQALVAELTAHMLKEEQVLFPYVSNLEQAVLAGKPEPVAFFGTVKNPIRAMINEHDAAGDLLKQMRKASNGFQAPADGCGSYTAMYQGIEEFEKDLHLHIHLENNILFPRAVKMEETGAAA
jgi:regulator of cell morphogenesis and NO signaling